MPETMPLAERGERIAAGRTGLSCPFCAAQQVIVVTARDLRGVLDQTWMCDNCDESGSMLDGKPHWEPES